MLVGGMPEAVNAFLATNDLNEVLRIQKNIIADYLDDIAKYAPEAEKTKARACFLSIPKQLSRENKKFSYGIVEKKAGQRKYGGSLKWLRDAGIVSFCYKVESPTAPLEGFALPQNFKVYMNDTGLLVAMLGKEAQKEFILNQFDSYKGALFENACAEAFVKNAKPLYFFKKDNSLEIDFLIHYKQAICDVEVKASTNNQAKSLKSLLANYPVSFGIFVKPGNIGKTENVLTIPTYMASFL